LRHSIAKRTNFNANSLRYQKLETPLNTELFIAKRLVKEHSFQGLIAQRMSKIATISIAISTAVMVLAISIVIGFKKEIREKVTGFSAPIQITKLALNNSLETAPLNKDWVPISNLEKISNVKSIHPYTIKAGIVKTNEEIQGIILKGVDSTYDWSFFASNLVEGRLPNYKGSNTSDEVLISRTNASKLRLKLGDKVKTYFVQKPFRMRSFKIVGIYDSKFQEFDSKFVISDLRHTQKLNQWNSDQYAGFEILLNDFNTIKETSQQVVDIAGYRMFKDGSRLRVENIKESMSNIFDWLNLQDTNALVVLTLMTFVAAINMITGILILLLDRIRMIGILKALGMSPKSLRQVFIYLSSSIVIKGLLWGNIIGFSLSVIQKYTGVVKLEESTYYLSCVPISISIPSILLLNVVTFLLLALFMLIPLLIINKISPSEIIRYE
jgi:lipoprotein-releasing system permease protein